MTKAVDTVNDKSGEHSIYVCVSEKKVVRLSSRRGARCEEGRPVTGAIVLRGCKALATSSVCVYSFPYGGDKLFYFSLFKLHEKSKVKIGTEKVPDHCKKFFLRNVLANWVLHGLYSIKDKIRCLYHSAPQQAGMSNQAQWLYDVFLYFVNHYFMKLLKVALS